MSKPLTEKPHAEPTPTFASAGVMLDGQYIPPPQDRDGRIWIRTTALVQGTPEKLYQMWRSIEHAPLWQEQIVSVTQTGPTTSHWIMKSGDKEIEWDSEVLADEPGHRIAWRSIGGDSENAGEVVFEISPNGRGTFVTVLQEFKMGKIASAWETFIGRNPKQAVSENLRHFKALAETGEIPRTQGQPHGPRGIIAEAKQSLYGEKVVTPPGTSRTATRKAAG